MTKNNYHYGEILTTVPMMGLDLKEGKIVITGIMHPNLVSKYVDQESWKINDPVYLRKLFTQPWYFFQYIDDNYSGETLDLPAVVFDKVVRKQVNKND